MCFRVFHSLPPSLPVFVCLSVDMQTLRSTYARGPHILPEEPLGSAPLDVHHPCLSASFHGHKKCNFPFSPAVSCTPSHAPFCHCRKDRAPNMSMQVVNSTTMLAFLVTQVVVSSAGQAGEDSMDHIFCSLADESLVELFAAKEFAC